MWKKFLALFVLVAIATLISGCEMETSTDDSVVQCVGKADDPACVEPDTTESPPGDDITSESLDSGSTSSEDSGPSVECIPTIPDGTFVQCGDSLYPCVVKWDLVECTVSCWKKDGTPPPLFEHGKSFSLEYYQCVPLPGQ